MALQRLEIELQEFVRDPLENCTVGSAGDDLFHWQVVIEIPSFLTTSNFQISLAAIIK